MTILHEAGTIGVKIRLFRTHIMINDRRGCFGMIRPKTITIPLANVSTVEKKGTSKITIVTNDGKRHTIPAGFGRAGPLQTAILSEITK